MYEDGGIFELIQLYLEGLLQFLSVFGTLDILFSKLQQVTAEHLCEIRS